MRPRAWLLAAVLTGLAGANELAHPCERSAPLPGDEWLPRRRRPVVMLCGERPLPEHDLQLDELCIQQPLSARAAIRTSAVWLRAGSFRQWQSELGIELLASRFAIALGWRESGWSITGVDRGRGEAGYEWAVAFEETPWHVAWRQRRASRTAIDEWAIQLRQGDLRWGLSRESSPFGQRSQWQFGLALLPRPGVVLGGRLREAAAEFLLEAPAGGLRVALSVAASGPLRGGFAWALEWRR